MQRRKRSVKEQAEKLSFRLAPQYAEKLARVSEEAGLTPNQLGRIATMQLVNSESLKVAERIARLEDSLLRFRAEFQAAVHEE